MQSPLSIDLKNDLSTIPQSIERVACYLESKKIAPRDIDRTELLLEEILSNTIKYGYEDARDHLIHIAVAVTPQAFTITITDDVIPFDPRTKPTADNHTSIEDKKIGGLGLPLINNLADKIDHLHTARGNRCTFTLLRNDS